MTKQTNLDNIEKSELPSHPLFKNLLLLDKPEFGILTVISYYGRRKKTDGHYRYYWLCECECKRDNKNIKITDTGSLCSGRTISCGCLQLERLKDKKIIHGMCKSREYCIWKHIIQRCYNINCKEYPNYGGRGIIMCEEWKNNFPRFLEDMGKCPKNKTSIDRINNNGNYSPENCRWADQKEQMNNTRSNHFIEYNKEKLTLSQWSEKTGISERTLKHRIDAGWTIEEILFTPTRSMRTKKIEISG